MCTYRRPRRWLKVFNYFNLFVYCCASYFIDDATCPSSTQVHSVHTSSSLKRNTTALATFSGMASRLRGIWFFIIKRFLSQFLRTSSPCYCGRTQFTRIPNRPSSNAAFLDMIHTRFRAAVNQVILRRVQNLWTYVYNTPPSRLLSPFLKTFVTRIMILHLHCTEDQTLLRTSKNRLKYSYIRVCFIREIFASLFTQRHHEPAQLTTRDTFVRGIAVDSSFLAQFQSIKSTTKISHAVSRLNFKCLLVTIECYNSCPWLQSILTIEEPIVPVQWRLHVCCGFRKNRLWSVR